MRLDIEDGLKGKADSPEGGNIRTYGACQGASFAQLGSIQNAKKTKSDDRQNDIQAVNPDELPVQPRQALQLVAPIQAEWHQGRCEQHTPLSEARQEDQQGQRVFHGLTLGKRRAVLWRPRHS